MDNFEERAVTNEFLAHPSEDTFAALFRVFSPQLVAFFRKRGHESVLAEDLAQDVMFTVYRKAGQIRDRALFRAWLFKIARNAVCRHFAELDRKVPTVGLADVGDHFASDASQWTEAPSFEFRDWMEVLEPWERDVMTLRFVEGWEYHEIAADRAIPIGTVQWRVFNSKKKLSTHLNPRQDFARKAA